MVIIVALSQKTDPIKVTEKFPITLKSFVQGQESNFIWKECNTSPRNYSCTVPKTKKITDEYDF